MTYAVLEPVTINGIEFLVVQSLHEDNVPNAVLCGASVSVGDVYHGGGFSPRAAIERGKPARTLADAQSEKLAALEEWASSLRTRVAGTSDASKLAVYQTKYETALAALAGQAWAVSALTPEASARGETAESLATLVKTLGEQWRAAGLAIDAAYQRHKAAILAIATIDGVDNYDFTTETPP